MCMCKIFLGAMVILKVHDMYGSREVWPALWKVRKMMKHNVGNITLLTIILTIQGVGSPFYRLKRTRFDDLNATQM